MLADSITTEDNIHFTVHIDEAATWSHPAQTVRHADIDDLLTLCRHGRPRSGAFPVCCGIALLY